MNDTVVFTGFEPANTTPVPDLLFDELLATLSGTELKVLLYIIRRTWGFKKTSDSISLSQFQKGIVTRDGRVLDKGCGVKDRSTLIETLASLEAKGYIASKKDINPKKEHLTTTYTIRFKGSGQNRLPPVVGKTDQGSGAKPTRVVGNADYRSVQNPTTVVGKTDLQETVLQDTESQYYVIPSLQKESGESDALHAHTTPTPTFSAEDHHAIPSVSEHDAPAESQAEPSAYSQRSLQLTQGEIHATTHPLPARSHLSSVITDLHPAEMDTERTESEVMPPVAAGAIRSSSSIGAVFLAQEPECLANIPTFARERAALAADVCAMPAFSTGDVENCGDEETVQGAAVGYARAAARRPPGGEKERETAGPLPAAGEAAPAGSTGRPVAPSHAQRDGATPAVIVPAQAVPEVNPVRAAPPDNAVLIDTGKRGATLSATPGQQAGRGRTGQGQGKGRKKSASVAEDAPLPVTFTAAGQALWDAWASIFKTAPAPTKADTLAANDLAPKIAVWAVELSLSRKDVLNKIRGWLWAKDRQRGYYRERGMYLFDLAREFGGWQEAAERKLEEHALLTAPPRGRQQTSVVTPEMLAAARAAREAGKSVQVIDVNGKLEVIAR